MDLVVEMWKNNSRKSRLVFPQFQQPKRIGLLIIVKMQSCKAAPIFPFINKPDDDKIFIYEIK